MVGADPTLFSMLAKSTTLLLPLSSIESLLIKPLSCTQPSSPAMLSQVIGFASVMNLSEGSRARWKFVFQNYPPAIDTLVTGMSQVATQPSSRFLKPTLLSMVLPLFCQALRSSTPRRSTPTTSPAMPPSPGRQPSLW